MSRTEIFEKLNEIFRDVFDNKALTVEDTTTVEDVEGWDSLAHIMLLSAAEEEFGIKFDMKAVLKLKNVGAMVDLIQAQMK